MRSKNMIGTLDQKRSEVGVSSLSDAQLWVPFARLAASRPQAEVAADIATPLEAFLAAKRQDIGQRRELADAVDLEQRLCFWILRLRESFDGAIVVLDLYRHSSDLFQDWAKRLGPSWRQDRHASLREAQRGRGRQSICAGPGQSAHRVHCSSPQTNDQVTGADQLLFYAFTTKWFDVFLRHTIEFPWPYSALRELTPLLLAVSLYVWSGAALYALPCGYLTSLTLTLRALCRGFVIAILVLLGACFGTAEIVSLINFSPATFSVRYSRFAQCFRTRRMGLRGRFRK